MRACICGGVVNILATVISLNWVRCELLVNQLSNSSFTETSSVDISDIDIDSSELELENTRYPIELKQLVLPNTDCNVSCN